ncbi:hypothetical protein VOI32_18515 [Paraburkholderia caribensis]|uniref:Uncharacterized protein n=1 Tax=Paraburkholderia caribensis TaxID=75105 RepID=A0A9Q6S1T5_9BURK|nr:hypothetical protein [Paraburkholderia caribensis]MCO4879934.1 hypothetical protein [Paraburkholderia caribensis]PTB27773.1 hypothetical protein C9I56_16290 [Paraburkholderia caribensis]QLB62945.1 hypothetical protein A9O66_11465 [Paraburkholderia caribensis]
MKNSNATDLNLTLPNPVDPSHAADSGPDNLKFGEARLPLAPYLFVSITGGPEWALNKARLHAFLKSIVGANDAVDEDVSEWPIFAQNQNLMAGNSPFTNPTNWFRGSHRWITATWISNWEVHLHFGFSNVSGSALSHLELAKASKHWLPKLARKAKSWWRVPTVAGEAMIATYETGIQIVPRQPFLKTLLGKDSVTTAAAVCVPCVGYLIKNYHPDDSFGTLGIDAICMLALIIVTTSLIAAFRHFFALPRFSWSVALLQD